MPATTLLPDAASVELVELRTDETGVTMVVRPRRTAVCCPDCGAVATRVHSRYQRRLGDLPWQGLAVRIRLHTRRWCCAAAGCARRIFTERFPVLVPPHGRRTARLGTLLTALAFALGGRPAARLLAAIGPVVSHDTLINTIRRADLVPAPTPRVLGVDDWSYRRGKVFGTILVDLERHRPIDLLPDRTATTFAAWLTAHPGVEVIARDRGGAYADGARQGAPTAVQVADRFHRVKNLGEALERLLDRHHAALRAAARGVVVPEGATVSSAAAATSAASSPARTPTRAERERAQRQARREARHAEIRALIACGASERAVARQLGLRRDTVRRQARAERCPHYPARSPWASALASHEAYLRERWAAGARLRGVRRQRADCPGPLARRTGALGATATRGERRAAASGGTGSVGAALALAPPGRLAPPAGGCGPHAATGRLSRPSHATLAGCNSGAYSRPGVRPAHPRPRCGGAGPLARTGRRERAARVPGIRGRAPSRQGRRHGRTDRDMERRPGRGAGEPAAVAEARDVRARERRPAAASGLAQRLSSPWPVLNRVTLRHALIQEPERVRARCVPAAVRHGPPGAHQKIVRSGISLTNTTSPVRTTAIAPTSATPLFTRTMFSARARSESTIVVLLAGNHLITLRATDGMILASYAFAAPPDAPNPGQYLALSGDRW